MTPEQRFGIFSKTGEMPKEKPKEIKGYGVLELDGKPVENPLPYALAQVKKKEYMAAGINPKRLKIRKHYE